jgi:hypothetical protein
MFVDGTSFQVIDPKKLEGEILPKYFRHSKFQSFVRQLNFYKFQRASKGRSSWIYCHDLFQRHRPELLDGLRRKTHNVCKAIVDMASNFAEELMQYGDGEDNGYGDAVRETQEKGPGLADAGVPIPGLMAQSFDPMTLGALPLFQLDPVSGHYMSIGTAVAPASVDGSFGMMGPAGGFIAIPTNFNVNGGQPLFTLAPMFPQSNQPASFVPPKPSGLPAPASASASLSASVAAAVQVDAKTASRKVASKVPATKKPTSKPVPSATPPNGGSDAVSSGICFKDLVFRPLDTANGVFLQRGEEFSSASAAAAPEYTEDGTGAHQSSSEGRGAKGSRKRSLSLSQVPQDVSESQAAAASKIMSARAAVPMLDLMPFIQQQPRYPAPSAAPVKRVNCCKTYAADTRALISQDILEIISELSANSGPAAGPGSGSTGSSGPAGSSAALLMGVCKEVVHFCMNHHFGNGYRVSSDAAAEEPGSKYVRRADIAKAVLQLLESNDKIYQDFVDYAATLSPVVAFELNKATPRPDGFLSPRHTYRSKDWNISDRLTSRVLLTVRHDKVFAEDPSPRFESDLPNTDRGLMTDRSVQSFSLFGAPDTDRSVKSNASVPVASPPPQVEAKGLSDYSDSISTSTDSLDEVQTFVPLSKRTRCDASKNSWASGTVSGIPTDRSNSSALLSDLSTSLGAEFVRTFLTYAVNNLRSASACLESAMNEIPHLMGSYCSCPAKHTDSSKSVAAAKSKKLLTPDGKECPQQLTNMKLLSKQLNECADEWWQVAQIYL